MILLFLKANWLPIALVIGAFVIITGIYAKGHADGTAEGRAAQLKATFEQLKQRSATDATVQGMSDPDLCAAIHGQLLDGKCQ